LAEPIAVVVTEPSQVGEARRAAVALAGLLGFDETEIGKVALVVTEAASNLVKHASAGGTVLLVPIERGGAAGVEVLALDRGPGVADLAACLRDGFSTAGSPGMGLGAITRLSAFTDFYSRRPGGTAVVARLFASPPLPCERTLDVAAIAVAKAGEPICGDCWAVGQDGGLTLLLVADGLGHGPDAAMAARAAARIFRENLRLGPAGILAAADAALRGTRGAAVAVAAVDPHAREVRFAGVGNVTGTVVEGLTSRGMVSHNGIVGHAARTFQEFSYPFPPGALIVMHSDGLATRWSLDDYPGLTERHPSLIAGVLYRDFQRGRDDATVLVARDARGDAGS
jgi:anti-sigma regulatory factor (Ser/Thr protein kinase)